MKEKYRKKPGQGRGKIAKTGLGVSGKIRKTAGKWKISSKECKMEKLFAFFGKNSEKTD